MIPIERGVQMSKGERLLEDSDTLRVNQSVQRGVSVSSSDIVEQFRKANPQEKVDIHDVEFRLFALSVNGYVLRNGPDSGGPQLFSPSAKEVKTPKDSK